MIIQKKTTKDINVAKSRMEAAEDRDDDFQLVVTRNSKLVTKL